jgi:hypothetical protein
MRHLGGYFKAIGNFTLPKTSGGFYGKKPLLPAAQGIEAEIPQAPPNIRTRKRVMNQCGTA